MIVMGRVKMLELGLCTGKIVVGFGLALGVLTTYYSYRLSSVLQSTAKVACRAYACVYMYVYVCIYVCRSERKDLFLFRM
ncbi:hypothetical protein BO83DRAFT_173809 [Aspergillus eucalypticola CBS 122712]|uniref:Uncharacterized protein n=1 Tax=Aspergillus eucalypticola (strain CBS 122712 / IBT 29274) TaxID=1448314 RepID=A0A317W4D0_ASPEC|nr:uncharacterized protein BO83DRAFT_173809 [Aspergillus eucalypticola CBS 122712]PWY81293.1 hypothetical protein BO83DRAFT_173809 [Aspergillus eucalypticola CBS 122712]